MTEFERIEIAYKKLKASTFFDKTLLPLRDSIVKFEDAADNSSHGFAALHQIEQALFANQGWDSFCEEILDSIGVLVYPKKLVTIEDKTAIFNSDSIPIELEKPQYFIDLSVPGHILSVLWILTFGIELDKNADADHPDGMYEHSYGNRLRKTLINNETNDYTFAPGLFEPYFAQYESWRDLALEKAKERLEDAQDALILTLDFKSFYYSVDIPKSFFSGLIQKGDDPWKIRLNDLIYKILLRYSEKLRNVIPQNAEPSIDDRTVLPIGFLPSNILANRALIPFDNAIIENWNPVYYGRYVDDIIIVDKVEKNSLIYRQARSKQPKDRLNAEKIITYLLCKTEEYNKGIEILEKHVEEIESPSKCKKKKVRYTLVQRLLNSPKSNIMIQGKKVRLLYFQSGATKALLNCFQSIIKDNTSEFRLMPELDAVYQSQDYSDIFQIENEDSINKLRSVTGVKLNKFALSKFLGKYRLVGGMITDQGENTFTRDVMTIFDERTLIENYSSWERLFEIFMVSDRPDLICKISLRIIQALNRYCVPINICQPDVHIFDGLIKTLHAALCRTLALRWGKALDVEINNISNHLKKELNSQLDKQLKEKAIHFSSELINCFESQELKRTRSAYCKTRMVNKYILPLPVDTILKALPDLDKTGDVKMYSLESMGNQISSEWQSIAANYRYHPYLVLPQDISFSLTYEQIIQGKDLMTPYKQKEAIETLFLKMNYPTSDISRDVYELSEVRVLPKDGVSVLTNKAWYATVLDCPGQKQKKDILRIAVGSARLNANDFVLAMDQKPNRSYSRYRSVAEVIDTVLRAKDERADLLVLPESFLPMEWLPVIMRICANNQLALVTGIEHVIVPRAKAGNKEKTSNIRGLIYNLTAVILPYIHDNHKFSYLAFHNKVDYSPSEIESIQGYRYGFHPGNTFQLFSWKGVWFPVYCCYELTSILNRSIFQSYADLVIAVEWNKDIHYFSNIIESLVRDLHCYCIQANSSDYGDSRVLQPTDTLHRDIIKTKGGKNNIALIDTIDIKALRDFQMKSPALQKKEGPYKQTPSNYNLSILEAKRNGTLADLIDNNKR